MKVLEQGMFYYSSLRNLTFDHGKVRFEVGDKPESDVVFEGVLSADGSQIVGQLNNDKTKHGRTFYRLIPNRYRSMTLDQLKTEVDRGDAKAMVELGYRLYYADGTKMDLVGAETLFRKALDKGIANELTQNWYFGIGFKKDFVFAYKCFERLKAYDWVALMRHEGLGVPRDPAGAVSELTKSLADMSDERDNDHVKDLDEVHVDNARVGLTYYPSDKYLLEEFLMVLKKPKPELFVDPSLKPSTPSCYMAETETSANGCMNDESAVAEEKTAVFARVALADASAEIKTVFKDYEISFQTYKWSAAGASGWIYEGGTMQRGVEVGTAFGLQSDHQHEVEMILNKELEKKATELNYQQADLELNGAYRNMIKQARALYSEVGVDLHKRNEDYSLDIFRKSEKDWIAYRDSATRLIDAIYANDPQKSVAVMKFKIYSTVQQTNTIGAYLRTN